MVRSSQDSGELTCTLCHRLCTPGGHGLTGQPDSSTTLILQVEGMSTVVSPEEKTGLFGKLGGASLPGTAREARAESRSCRTQEGPRAPWFWPCPQGHPAPSCSPEPGLCFLGSQAASRNPNVLL